MAWLRLSPSRAGHSSPPLSQQSMRELRKYQQRGRCRRLPPSVARLRICSVAASEAAWASAAYLSRTRACSSISASVVSAPISSPSAFASMPRGSSAFTLTSRSGAGRSALRSVNRSVPPASGRAAGPMAPSAASSVAGFEYANGLMVERHQKLVTGYGKVAEAHAGGVENGIGDRRGGRNDRRLADAFRAERVRLLVRHALGGVHDLGDVAQRGHLVLLQVGVERLAQPLVHHALFRQRIADALRHAADHLALHQERIDDASAIVRGHHAQHGDLAGLGIDAHLHALRAAGSNALVLRILAALGTPVAALLRLARGLQQRGADRWQRGAAGARGPVQARLRGSNANIDLGKRNTQLGGGNLRERRARSGADVLHADDHLCAAVAKGDFHRRRRPAAARPRPPPAPRHPVVRGEADTFSLAVPLEHAGSALDAAAQALRRGIGLVVFGLVDLGVVLEAKLDRIDAGLVRELIHRRLEREVGLDVSRTAKSDRRAGVDLHRGLLGAHVFAVIKRHVRAGEVAVLPADLVGAGLEGDARVDRGQRAVALRADAKVLARGV